MLRIGMIEKEEIAKNIIFSLSKVLDDEFSFVHFEKISEFIKVTEAKGFDIIFLDEAYNNIRVSSALDYQRNNSIIIYCSKEEGVKPASQYTRVFTINTDQYENELERIKPYLIERLKLHKEYLFDYNGIKIKLKYHDIYYIEKEDKNLVYHTKRGIFKERGSIAKKSGELEHYDFVRIHSGIIVNYEYIFRIDNDEVELLNHEVLTISRARKRPLANFIRLKKV